MFAFADINCSLALMLNDSKIRLGQIGRPMPRGIARSRKSTDKQPEKSSARLLSCKKKKKTHIRSTSFQSVKQVKKMKKLQRISNTTMNTSLLVIKVHAFFISNAIFNSASVLLSFSLNPAADVAQVLFIGHNHHHIETDFIFSIFRFYIQPILNFLPISACCWL